MVPCAVIGDDISRDASTLAFDDNDVDDVDDVDAVNCCYLYLRDSPGWLHFDALVAYYRILVHSCFQYCGEWLSHDLELTLYRVHI